MAFAWFLKLCHFAILLSFSIQSGCQGAEVHLKYRYPFIKVASSFGSPEPPLPRPSPTPSSSTWKNRAAKKYDYIIVGGGTAGCPLAATLSQNFSVLLLERGGVPFDNRNVSHMENFHLSLADISSRSASQAFISTDGVINARARVLGGGSSINAGFYTRASPSFVKRAGWDGELVNQSYPWVEKQIVKLPKLAPWQDAVRKGLLEVGISPFNGFSYDHMYGTKVGGSIFDHNGTRHTAAELLHSANPHNIHVLIRATVHRIVFDTAGKVPKAVKVVFTDEKGQKHEAHLSNDKQSEVILSSGAIGTPQLLLLSGIGPVNDLKMKNIPVVLENNYVGKEMADNPMNTIFIPTKEPVKQSLIETVGITKLGVFIEASSGFGQSGDSIQCNHGIMSAEFGQLSTIPPKQRTMEAIQAYREKKPDLPYELFRGGFILGKIARPLSTGELRLDNTNINDNPKVTFNYFSHPYDLQRCVEGVRLMEKVVRSKHFAEFSNDDALTMNMILNMSVKANVNLIPKHTDNTKSLQQFCKDTVITIWHYHGGCHVGKVVDKKYRVLGVDRLRVVDGSVYNESPGTNPQATVMMMGRYMGVKILRERLGRRAGL
ncbi:hypothetical protein IFM89_021683 [Coptis chinensis]|uniref:Glucose-methanol-choline oxidoreductase N-terminal domain-containing protein n=1 Tax=Coptis chinensis TaxID=261450 RepID=A0A835M3J9_9MAGN|nr:hypothetical protein IFM89_021683 [Coptis chinensis]